MTPLFLRKYRRDLFNKGFVCVFALCFMLTLAVLPHNAHAVEGEGLGTWQNRAALYFWLAGLDGSSGNRLQAGDIEASFSDIMENFEAGFMLDYRGKKGKWAVGLDLIYLNLNPESTLSGPNPLPLGPSTIYANGDINVKQWVFDFTGRYEVVSGLELFAGGRYVDLDIDAEVTFPGPGQNQLKVSGTESWVDPIVGAEYRGRFPNSQMWRYSLHGDVGGFGVSSDLTWQLYGYVGYQPSSDWIVYGGYRHMEIDYQADNRAKFFYDTAIGGPVLGVGYNF